MWFASVMLQGVRLDRIRLMLCARLMQLAGLQLSLAAADSFKLIISIRLSCLYLYVSATAVACHSWCCGLGSAGTSWLVLLPWKSGWAI